MRLDFPPCHEFLIFVILHAEFSNFTFAELTREKARKSCALKFMKVK